MLAGLGFYYWLYCGDPDWVDWVILAELGVLAVGYWMLAVLAASQSERLRDANPLRVAERADRLGWRALAAAFIASLLAVPHGLLAIQALEHLHSQPALGILLTALGWLSGLFWATFFFRLLGVWCYRCR
jgi:hypothetical protein